MRKRKKLSSFQVILLGFLGLILIGTLLLMLPAASKSGQATPAGDALFTATSAACVTGLIVRDTATYWSAFGQTVILVLIQIGGLGVISMAVFIAMLSGRKISLFQRTMMQDSISAPQVGGIVRMTRFIFRCAVAIEAAGALLLLPAFCRAYGARGIWPAVFHSVSAFCNAGFDVMGDKTGAFSSLTGFGSSVGVLLPVCLLIVIGGIGFLTWDDVATHKLRFKKYRMQSKVALAVSGLLILLPAALFFFGEYGGHPTGERICLSLFQSITTRTAGFNTADLTALTGAGQMLFIFLMLIGGSPGSTAGGMKTTTVAVLAANAAAVFRKKKSARLFGRRIEDSVVKDAATLLVAYLALALTGAAVISMAEGLPVGTCLFETASAVGTVGLTLGITPALGTLSRLILIFLMFFGRVGGLTLMYATVSAREVEVSQLPVERISVG